MGIKITQNELQGLEAQLKLENEKLEAQRASAKRAKADGDLSENAAWDNANNEIQLINVIIRNLKDKIDNAEVVDDATSMFSGVGVQSIITTLDIGLDVTRELKIVSPGMGRIPNEVSSDSKFGSAVLGRFAGDNFAYYDNQHTHHDMRLLSVK